MEFGVIEPENLQEWASAQTAGGTFMLTPSTSQGVPYPMYWRGLLTGAFPGNDRALLIFTEDVMHRASTGSGKWDGPWRKVADCIAPELHDLPLASGFPTQSYANTYYKTQEDIVHLNFCITRGSNTAFTASEVVCTLPVGYRPSSVRMFSVGGDSGYFGTVAAPVQVYVTSDGELKFINCAQKVTWIYGEITYLAG